MEQCDVIVVGGGLGGLTAGAKLAKEGKRVLLIEQHSIPGGCATTFRRKGILMEAGLHEMDGLDAGDPKRRIFEELGVFDACEFIHIPEFYRVVTSKSDIVVPHGTDEAIETLIRTFPAEEKGIRTFFRVVNAIRDEISRLPESRMKTALLFPLFPLLYPHLSRVTNRMSTILFPLFPLLHPGLLRGEYRTVGGFVDGIIRDEELKIALLANFPYYHDDPYSLSLLYFSVAQGSYYQGGGHFIKGGSQRLSDHLADVIRMHGGEVLLNARVRKILIETGRVAGVEFEKKGVGTGQIAKASVVVANAALPLVEEMLPEPERRKLRQRTTGKKPSCSFLTVYIGFKRDMASFDNPAYFTMASEQGVRSLREFGASVYKDYGQRGFVFVDYSRIDSGLGAEGKSYGVICVLDRIEEWEGLDSEAYRQKKAAAAESLIGRLDVILPGIRHEIETVEVSTPVTIRRYTQNPGGVVYGYAQIPEQSGIFGRVPNRSPVPGLWFASAWSNPGGGFTGAILSGWFSAREILST